MYEFTLNAVQSYTFTVCSIARIEHIEDSTTAKEEHHCTSILNKEIKKIKYDILCGGNSGGKEIIAIKFTPEVFTFRGNCGDPLDNTLEQSSDGFCYRK